MISRVTDPRNFELLGLPPVDLLEDVADALREAGFDVVDCFRLATEVTSEWKYTPGKGEMRDRFTPQRASEFTIPVRARKLAEILNPQPRASIVIHKLLDWIDRVDIASQCNGGKPDFTTAGGGCIFPDDDDPWWLTELSRRAREEDAKPAPGDEDGPAASDEEPGPDEDALTNDSDPVTDDDGPNDGHVESQAIMPLKHMPEVAWVMPSVPSSDATMENLSCDPADISSLELQ